MCGPTDIVVYKVGDPCTEFVVSSAALTVTDVDGWLSTCVGISEAQLSQLRRVVAREFSGTGVVPISVHCTSRPARKSAAARSEDFCDDSPVSVLSHGFEPPTPLELPESDSHARPVSA